MNTRPVLRFTAWMLPLLALVSFAAGDESADLAVKMQGNWKATSSSRGTQTQDNPDLVMVIDGDTIKVIVEKHADDSATFKVDATKSPVEIDIKPGRDGQTVAGIVKLNGDELKMAFRKTGDRPTSFDAVDGVTVVTLKKDAGASTMPAATQP